MLLRVSGLFKEYAMQVKVWPNNKDKYILALDDVSFHLKKGQTLAVVGESGCGKSTLARVVASIEPPDFGAIHYYGKRLGRYYSPVLNAYRRQMGFVFQDAISSFNPRLRVRDSLIEPMMVNGIGGRRERLKRAVQMLNWVGIPSSALNCYPHEFSSGQRQRISIARALILKPDLLIADDPFSSLDASTQCSLIGLLKELQGYLGFGLVIMTHDMTLVYHMADRVLVMKAGAIIESYEKQALFDTSKQGRFSQYTQTLLNRSHWQERKKEGL